MATFSADAITVNSTAGNKIVAITPAVRDLLLAIVFTTGTTTNPTVTDNQGGSYDNSTKVAIKNASADEMHLFCRTTPVASAVSHSLTSNVSGAGDGGGIWVCRIAGMGIYGINAIRQCEVQNNQAGGGTPTVTFTSAAYTENWIVGAVFNATNPAGMAFPVNFTERRDTGYTIPTAGFEVATRDSGHTATTVTWNGTSASAFCAIACELKVRVTDDDIAVYADAARHASTW